MSLIALRDTAEAFANNIDYWVMGGYAIDITVGRVTREHKNADVLIRLNDTGKAVNLLNKKGYTIQYANDKLVALKDNQTANLIILYENKEKYILNVLNAELKIPKTLMNTPVTGELEGFVYNRIPNELLYTLNKYTLKQTDATIINNIPKNKKTLKEIKIKIKH